GATNPHAPGVRMSEALLSRFRLHVEMTSDWALAIRLGVPMEAVTFASNLNRKVVEEVVGWAPQFRELIAFRDVALEFGEIFAVRNMLALAPEHDRDVVIDTAVKVWGKGARPAKI